MKINKFFESTSFYTILSIVLTLIIFVNARSRIDNNLQSVYTQAHETLIKDVPVELEYDHNKFYVYDYEDKVDVKLTSSNLFQLNREEQLSTRTFHVKGNLKKLGFGTYKITLELRNLDSTITGKIKKKEIYVTIDKLVKKEVIVTPKVDQDQIEDGYEIAEDPSCTPDKVTLTTGEKLFKSAKTFEAILPKEVHLSEENYDGLAEVVAYDSRHKPLSSYTIEPPQVQLQVIMKHPSKTVVLKVAGKNKPDNMSDYRFGLSTNKVRIYGKLEELSKIPDELLIEVDLSKFDRETTFDRYLKDIIKDPHVSFKPTKISITVTPTMMQSTTSTSSSINGELNQTTTATTTVPQQQAPATSSSQVVESTGTTSPTEAQNSAPVVEGSP